jgi:hypothetical protein
MKYDYFRVQPFEALIGIHDETLDDTNLQVISNGFDFMRIYVVYVWLACTRESHLVGSRSSEVWYLLPFKQPSSLLKNIISLLATENHAYFRTFTVASIAGIYSLFPLLFTPAGQWLFAPTSRFFRLNSRSIKESLVKLIYSVLWIALVLGPINRRVYECVDSRCFTF